MQYKVMFVTGGVLGATFAWYLLGDFEQQKCKESEPTEAEKLVIEGTADIKLYSKDTISKHRTKESGIWVTYEHGVYDITEFVEQHPGGSSKIMLAAGGALEPFWAMYAIHKKDEVLEILAEYKIGEVRHEDRVKDIVKGDGPFAHDPERHPALIANSKEPFNAETPPQLAADNFITPNELFFVRNHLPVPTVDEKVYKLEVEGLGMKNIKLSLDDLKQKFKKHTVVAALQCAGNRRSEMNKIKTVKGLSWSKNAISNAEWSGVLLRDVLLNAGIDPNSPDIQHIQFEGLDLDPTKAPYGASIPVDKVFDTKSEVLLAYEMNGEPLPRDHGFPLRVVCPGVVGARNVKWLSRIIASNEESKSHWQQNDYKGFSPNIDWHNVDFKSAPAIQDSPVTSAICLPADGSSISEDEEEIAVQGYAYSGGGRGIIRVDVSADGGKTWHTADLQQADQKLNTMWAWTLWKIDLPIPEDHRGKLDICCKAVDSSYNTQPDSVSAIWNLRGVLNNSWNHVNIQMESSEDD